MMVDDGLERENGVEEESFSISVTHTIIDTDACKATWPPTNLHYGRSLLVG